MQECMNAPVFILGSHKSGSSLLRSLLDSHPELFVIPTEIHYFQYTGHWVDYRLRYALPKKMDREAKIDSLINLIKKKNSHIDPYADSVIKGQFDVAKFEKFIENNSWKSDRELFELYVKAIHLSLIGEPLPPHLHFVEKSVENAEFAVFLKQMFPNCRFIHIVRNPYASLVAIRKSKTKNNYPLIRDFILSLQNSYYYLYKNQKMLENYLIIRYEDLLLSTEETMSKITDFLKIEFTRLLLTPTVMSKPWGGNSSNNGKFSKVSSEPLKKWRKQISTLEVELVNTFFDSILKDYNYEQLEATKSKFFPASKEDFKTYVKNRSLFWLKPVCSYSP